MRVAILGGGPCGSALALLLAREGAEVALFDDGRRPEIVVGESLVPAIVPLLKRLDIEEETAKLGLVKPGVSFNWSPVDRFSFTFARFSPAVPAYAYNIPRPQFDEALLAKAVSAGARRVDARARVEPTANNANGSELALAPESLALAPVLGGRQPDLVVDATGRARLVARVLKIPARVGPRDDVAHFAHFENCQWEEAAGQVVIGRLDAGWSWCIPLRDRVSVGVVMAREDAARLGRTPAERLEHAIAAAPRLSAVVDGAKRVTGVATYSNYQLISRRGHGPGWVMIGDAFGFVDPMLSPGVFLALRSAELVADALIPFVHRGVVPSPSDLAATLRSYAATQTAMLDAWSDLVGTFYDGRMAALIRAGRGWMEHGRGPATLKTAAQNHIEKHVAMQASGVATTSRYSRGLLRFLGRHGLRGVAPSGLAIR
ncbi:MAG TPA: NAD(P)/FAD-dependent oxidoreductase [Solirubrobacteraceae bacterium]